MFLHSYRQDSTLRIGLNHIVTAVTVANGMLRITDTQGGVHSVSQGDWELAEKLLPVSVFPAPAGTNVLEAFTGEGGEPDDYLRTTVLGWGVFPNGDIRPVTLDAESEGPYIVEHPDGRVESSNSLNRWPDATAWFNDRK